MLALNLILGLYFFSIKIPVWFLLFGFAIFYAFKLFNPRSNQMKITNEPKINFGVLGDHHVDGEADGTEFGLYISLNGKATFIDLKIDSFLEQRKKHANFLFVNQRVIEANLNDFMKRNANFSQRVVNSIGLHSKNLTQGEVFWDPDGYTILQELQFVDQ